MQSVRTQLLQRDKHTHNNSHSLNNNNNNNDNNNETTTVNNVTVDSLRSWQL